MAPRKDAETKIFIYFEVFHFLCLNRLYSLIYSLKFANETETKLYYRLV